MANYCRKCGNVLLEDSQFCENCGTQISQATTDSVSARGKKFSIFSLVFGIVGLAYSAVSCIVALTTDAFKINNMVILVVVAAVLNVVSLFFSIVANKRENNNQMCRIARIVNALGFVFLIITIVVMIIAASTASNEAQRVQSVIDSFRNDDILNDWYDYY